MAGDGPGRGVAETGRRARADRGVLRRGRRAPGPAARRRGGSAPGGTRAGTSTRDCRAPGVRLHGVLAPGTVDAGGTALLRAVVAARLAILMGGGTRVGQDDTAGRGRAGRADRVRRGRGGVKVHHRYQAVDLQQGSAGRQGLDTLNLCRSAMSGATGLGCHVGCPRARTGFRPLGADLRRRASWTHERVLPSGTP